LSFRVCVKLEDCENRPSGAQARQYFSASFTARLKSCPDTKPSSHADSLAPGMGNTAANPRVHVLDKKRSAGAEAQIFVATVRPDKRGCGKNQYFGRAFVPNHKCRGTLGPTLCHPDRSGPGFPVRGSRHICVCGFLYGKPREVHSFHQPQQEIRVRAGLLSATLSRPYGARKRPYLDATEGAKYQKVTSSPNEQTVHSSLNWPPASRLFGMTIMLLLFIAFST
jgi:hypothetical protein